MKKIVFILVVMLLFSHQTCYACDGCGGSSGNYYFGVSPLFTKNFVGVRYRHRSFTSNLGTQQSFQNAELWGRFYPLKNLQIWAFVPYNFNSQTQTNAPANASTKKLSGLGDITLMANYQIFNKKDSSSTWKHNLLLGGGVKFPTGNYQNTDENNKLTDVNFQMGTGSLDFILNAAYTIRYKKMGLSTNFSYQINTTNPKAHQFGDRMSGLVSLFYVHKIGQIALMPSAGIFVESSKGDKQSGISVTETGGKATFANLGLETYYKQFSVGFQYQIPMAQNLQGSTMKANNRLVAHFTVMF